VPNEKNQVFRRKVSRIPSICQSSCLYNLKCKGQPQGRGKQKGSYKLDQLAPDDILYQIYCLREWFLYLTEDEHLRKTAKIGWGKTGACSRVSIRTIWEISCWYLYSFFFSPISAEVVVVFLAGVIICRLTMTGAAVISADGLGRGCGLWLAATPCEVSPRMSLFRRFPRQLTLKPLYFFNRPLHIHRVGHYSKWRFGNIRSFKNKIYNARIAS
jgi:hypothetical protein